MRRKIVFLRVRGWLQRTTVGKTRMKRKRKEMNAKRIELKTKSKMRNAKNYFDFDLTVKTKEKR
jgi:hypothetical protein